MSAARGATVALLCAVAVAPACGAEDGDGAPPNPCGAHPGELDPAATAALPYAREVVRFTPGEGAGHGQDRMPAVVLGPPGAASELAGSLDVLSLGAGGEIVLGFGEQVIADGEGADFIVFENTFWAAGDPERPWAEPGEVAVSEDGETWHGFACDGEVGTEGCAGWRPTRDFDPRRLPLEPGCAGGDAFDLAELGLARARFVRVRDRAAAPGAAPPNAGFDLDAVGIVHAE